VGRGEEAAALRSAFAQAVAEKRCVLATVSGLAGKGKSRLIADAVQSFAGHARVLSGRCLPYGEATIYWPLAEITCQAAHIKQDEEPDAAIAAIAHLLSEDPDPAQLATVQRLAGAFGLGPLAGAAEEIAPDVVTLMRALTSDGPLVAVIEDIHWAAPGLLSALEHLASRLGDAPLLLICSARPELSEKRPDWPGEAPAALSVALGPLSDDDCAALIGELLEASQAADELLAPVLAVAGGNPLVVEEVLAMLIDEGTLTQGTEGWRLERELEEIRIPATIEAILGARLDRLSEPEREVIEAAAVVGKDFDLAEVRALAELKGHSLAEQIGALLDKQLIEVAVGSLSDYRFHHILVRDAAYAATPKRRRAELHERLGEHLERSPAGQREGTYGEIIGEHLERACLLRRELGADDEEVRELAHHAGILLAQSGARAQGLSDFLAGGRVYERGRAVLAADDPLRATLSLGLAEVKCDIGLLEEAQLAVTEAIALSDQLGLTEVQPRAAIILGLIEVLCGQRSGEDALPSLSRLAGELVQTGDSRGAWAWMACCGIAGLAALFTEAVNASEQAIALATRSFRDQLPYCLVGYCVAMARGPLAVEEATERCEAAHARVQQDTLHAAMMECQLAYLRGMSGDIIGARDRYEAALTACERYGAHRYRGAYLFDWGTCELLAGDFRRAETCFRRAGDLMADLDEMFSLEAASLHARALARLGQHAAALEEAEQASERMRTPDLEAQVWWRIAAALACSGMDKVDRAEKVAREALALARPTQAPHLLGDTLACLGEVLLHRESSQADPVLRESIAVYEAKGIRPGAEAVRQLLMSGAAGVTIR
jgi:AAA ATPase domain